MSDDIWNPDREQNPRRRGQNLKEDMFLEIGVMQGEVEVERI